MINPKVAVSLLKLQKMLISGRLTHLEARYMQMACVQEIFDPVVTTVMSLSLGYFVVVVRKT